MRLLFLLFLSVSFVTYGQQVSKVKIYTDKEGLKELIEAGVVIDHGKIKEGYSFTSAFTKEEVDIISDKGFKYDILISDLKAFYKSRNEKSFVFNKNATCASNGSQPSIQVPSNFETSAGSYAGFYRYQEMLDELDDMATLYPGLITVKAPISSFLTWEGNPIYHVKISDNPSTDEATEPKVLYTAIHHAREPMSMSQTIFYMWYLLENYATNEEVKYLVDHTEMYFVPCINVDGYLYNEAEDPSGFGMHRKNKNPSVGTSNPGVDLNRNYSYQWNTTGVSADENNDTYPGTSSFSEPETQAIKWLVENVGFTSAFNAHTYGNTLLFPVGATSGEFADHHDYFEDLSTHMCMENGYLPQKSSSLYPASGDSDDYMYKSDIGVGQKDTIFVMTPEVGSDFWPAQSEVIPTCQGMVLPNMILAHMTRLYYVVNETDPSTLATLSGAFNHDALRLGLEDGTVIVSIEPLTNIQTVGAPINYNLEIRSSASNSISYQLDPSIQFGDEVQYILKTEYPDWTRRDTIVKTYGTLPVQFVEDGSSTTNWLGSWTTTTSDYVSSPSCFTDRIGNYSNNTNKTFEYSQVIDLTNATDAMVSFYAKWEIESDYDFCQFQVSTDEGATWVGQCGNYTVTGANSGVQPENEPIYEGFQTSWVFEEISLSDYVGQEIRVRFQLKSDVWASEEGFSFDDFSISYDENTAGLNANSLDVLTFPNPASKEVKISTSQVLNKAELVVYNQAGQIIFASKSKGKENLFLFDTSRFSNGTYHVVINDGTVISQPIKLVVIH